MKKSLTLALLLVTHLFAFTQNDQLPPDFSPPQPGYVLQNPNFKTSQDTLPDKPAGTKKLSNLGLSELAPCDNYELLECGQTYYGHNNFGYGNDLVNYCVTGAFNGPDRVYRIDVPYDMPVKIVLDILDNVNLDILILSNCQTLVCAGWSIQNNPGLGVYREIADVHLTAGTYYVVIDGQYSTSYGSYNLTMDCSCSPLEDGVGYFFANEYFCDNFESFLPSGPVSDVSSRWEVWPAVNYGDGVSETDANGNQLAHLVNNNAPLSPYLIHFLDHQTSGRWRLSWRMRVENNKTGYFNILHRRPNANTSGNIAYRTVFNPDGTGYVRVGLNSNPNEARFNYPNGEWFNVVQIIDLDSDVIELWINDHFVQSWQFSRGVNTGGFAENINTLGGIGFVANNGYDYFIDDITLWKGYGYLVLCFDNYDPLCIENGTVSGNECEAKVGLYTELEWNKCFSICDYGGTFMYRGDSLTGQLGPSDLAPDSLRFAPCVVAAYGNNMPVPLYTDVFAFYNDNNSTITVTLNTANPDDVKYFLFSCNHDDLWVGKPDNGTQNSLPPCSRNQQCLTSGSTITPCDQLYYIVVTGPQNASYSLKVGPPGVCPVDPPFIDCNTTTSGSLLAGNGNSTFTASGSTYNKCYVGQRSYTGRESIYKFTLQNPSKVKITANSAAPIGIFLQSFVCGNNCINYAENTGSNPEAQIFTSLPAGNYYVAVDRNTTTGTVLFDLTLECTPISPLTSFDAFVKTFLPEEALCPADNSAQHQMKINALAFPFSNTDQLIFHYLDSGEPIGLSSPDLSELWGAPGPIKTINLPKDDEGDNKKCSFLPGDTINLRINPTDNGSLNVFETKLIFKQVPGTNAGGQYQVSGVSYVDSIRQLTPRLFHLDKSDLTFPPGSSTQNVRLQTNMPWEASVLSGDTSINYAWGITFSPISGAATETISITPWTRDPQDPASYLPRQQFIVFQGYSENYLYQAFLRLHQKGYCPPTTTAAINASSNTICEGSSVTLTAIGTPTVAGLYTYKWSTGDTSRVITKMPVITTSYNVTVTNINCNVTATATSIIIVQPRPIMPISLGDKVMCEGDAIIPTLSVSINNQPNIAVDWYDSPVGGALLKTNNLNYTPTVAVTKTYYAQSRNTGTMCVNAARTPVKLIVNLRPSINVIEKVCAINLLSYDIVLNTDADIVVASPGLVTGSPGQYIVSGIPAGIPVTVTANYSATNCGRTEVVSAPDCTCPTVATPVAGDSHIICSDEPIPELTVAVGANETAYWFNASGTKVAEGLSYLPGVAGVFSVYAVDLVNGCMSEFPATVSLTIHPEVELSTGAPVCSPNLQFFSVPLTTSPNVTQVTATQGVISGQNGNYLISNIPETSDVLVTGIDGNTGCVQQLFIPANDCPCPILDKPISGGDQTSCDGDPLPVLKVTVNPGETADWFNAFGQLQAGGQGTTEFTPLQPGIYYAQRRNQISGCTSAERTAVTATLLPTPALAVLDDGCEPLLTSYQVIVLTDGDVVSTIPVYPVINLNTNTFAISGIPIGTSVTISAAFNGTGCSTEQTVQRNDCPCSINPPTIEGANPVVLCLGDALPELIASVDDPLTETVYWFDVPSGGVPLLNGEATLIFQPTLAKTYYAEARKKDAPGCVSTIRRSVAILASTPPAVSAGPDQTVCANEAIQLSGTVSGAPSATWEASVLGGTFSPNANTLSNVSYTPPSGVTSVTLTLVSSDPPGPCPAVSDDLVVVLRPVPTIELDSIYCAQNLLTYNVIFSVDPSSASVQPNAGVLNVLGGGQFLVTGIPKNTDLVLSASNAVNGCSSQLFVQKYICDCITPDIPASKGNKEVCSNEPYPALEVEAPAAGIAVDWYEFVSGGNPLAQDTLAYQPAKGGTYFAETRDKTNNCKSLGRTPITLTVKPSPVADAGNNQTVCPGIPAVLTAAGTNYTYEWSNNATGKTITVPGEVATYYVTAILNGCRATDSVSVSTWPSVFGSINVAQPIDCHGNSTGTLGVSASGGAFPYSVKWSNGFTSPQNGSLPAGLYSATITDANTCRDTVTFHLDEPDPLEVSDTTIIWSSGGFDGALSVTVSGGTPPYVYQWIENGFILDGTQSSLDSLMQARFALIVTDDNGCSLTEFYSTVSSPGVDKDIFVIVYPNPTTGQLYIQFHLPKNSAVTASVTDMLGRTVVDKRLFNVMDETVELPLTVLPSGHYILHLQIEQSYIVHKISVNR